MLAQPEDESDKTVPVFSFYPDKEAIKTMKSWNKEVKDNFMPNLNNVRTEPSEAELQKLTKEQLKRVPDFKIFFEKIEVTFPG